MFAPRNDRDGQSLPIDPTDLPHPASLRAAEAEQIDDSALDAPEVPAQEPQVAADVVEVIDLEIPADDDEVSVVDDDVSVVDDEVSVVDDEVSVVDDDVSVVDDDVSVVDDDVSVVDDEVSVVDDDVSIGTDAIHGSDIEISFNDDGDVSADDDEPVVVEEEQAPEPTPAQPMAAQSARRRSLADRAPRPAMSALEALQAAKRAEEAAQASRPTKPRKSRKKSSRASRHDAPIEIVEEAEPTPAQQPVVAKRKAKTKARKASKPEASSPVSALADLGDYDLIREIPILDRTTFRAVWSAHRAHALNDGDLVMVAMASVLLDAAERIADGHLFAAEIRHSGVSYAVWIDSERNVLLGIALLPKIWLTGL